MEYMNANHFRIRASLAVLVIDDYTNKVISDAGIQVFIEDAAKPIRKSEGYYVFLNLTQSKVELTVKSDRYSSQKRCIDMSLLSKTDPIVKIRVKPNRNYALPGGTTCLQGAAEPFSEIRIFCEGVQKHLRLLYDYEAKENLEEIRIFNPEQSDLDGKIFQIKDKEERQETFYIVRTKDRENNSYHMESPLHNNYKKVGTKILPIYVTKADENGEYFIPMWNVSENSLHCRCEMNGKQVVSKDHILDIGKINKCNFDD